MSKTEGFQTTSVVPTPEYYLHLLWPEHDDGGQRANAWAIVMPESAGKREALLKAADFDQTWIIQELAEGDEIEWLRVPIRPYLAFKTHSQDFDENEDNA